MSYENPIPVAVSAVQLRGPAGTTGYLGIIRATAPGRGGLALPGGYVDKGESAEEAAARELEEETGIVTQPAQWRLWHSRVTPQNRLLVFCELLQQLDEELVQTLRPTPEVLGYKVLVSGDQLVFPTHQEFVELRRSMLR